MVPDDRTGSRDPQVKWPLTARRHGTLLFCSSLVGMTVFLGPVAIPWLRRLMLPDRDSEIAWYQVVQSAALWSVLLTSALAMVAPLLVWLHPKLFDREIRDEADRWPSTRRERMGHIAFHYIFQPLVYLSLVLLFGLFSSCTYQAKRWAPKHSNAMEAATAAAGMPGGAPASTGRDSIAACGPTVADCRVRASRGGRGATSPSVDVVGHV